MTRQQKLLNYLVADINQDCDSYGMLETLLQAIFPQLVERNTLEVATINSQINELVVAIAERMKRRSSILQALGITEHDKTSTHSSMLRALSLLPASERESALTNWKTLHDLVFRTHKLNERNGNLLAMQQEILNSLIDQSDSSGIYRSPSY